MDFRKSKNSKPNSKISESQKTFAFHKAVVILWLPLFLKKL